ncbi:DUF1566 domain-containing protein [Desulfonatronovibrio magnus]|uniref:Lcl C-terminal domain-containing protein n=1 Tax=Desulfonatronovibrio magnus TaxID=698827 RepID=UPI000695C572|nr:DUF1566 domain-containing protein [Desulfonatronovibrio magnus]
MRKMRIKIFTTAALTLMLCLTGLVMTSEAQAQRFVDNGNGTVTDTMTNLMWTKDADPFGRLNWEDAMSRCESFSISGIGGWRLPSRDELVALSHALKGGHPFTGVQSSNYWSSTSSAGYPDDAWFVDMYYGDVVYSYKPYAYHVWPVRAGQ